MRQSVCKKLRREMAEMPRMIEKTEAPAWRPNPLRKSNLDAPKYIKEFVPFKRPINFYRLSKKLYRGSVKKAVTDAINFASSMDSIGKYHFV